MIFSGFEKCILDANGRLKLSCSHVKDFEESGGLNIVLHCWPEGSIAVLPEHQWNQAMREQQTSLSQMLASPADRLRARAVMPLTCPGQITNQMRITSPQAFREKAGLECGGPVTVVGTGIGLEIWNCERWEAQMAQM